MRFVAGQGAVAEQLPVGTVAELLTWPEHQCRLAGTWQRAIGKQLPVGAVAELLTGTGHRGGAAAGSEVVQHHREENTGKDASTEEQLRDACRA